ncbi:unnamed protein product [Spirodela intermedia]|uniref:peptide-methionine (S)-S-oxide reductase n=1 Tax=Spirodela intermedia TaxID=51605 RepID=A0A7I8IH71_SPIIN|nr:unnamed protein product [Spirodela intermedia]CAA6657132.1 unnamed protein product [Spirodela intermedia]
MSWLDRIWVGFRSRGPVAAAAAVAARGPDGDAPAHGQQFAQFAAGCFWGVELAYQRGKTHGPAYGDICSGTTDHAEVVRVQYDPSLCSYESLLAVFWARHDPTTLNRQPVPLGIYFYTEEQERAAQESMKARQRTLERKIVTEILPARRFYPAEEHHQRYLEKGGRFGPSSRPPRAAPTHTLLRLSSFTRKNTPISPPPRRSLLSLLTPVGGHCVYVCTYVQPDGILAMGFADRSFSLIITRSFRERERGAFLSPPS